MQPRSFLAQQSLQWQLGNVAGVFRLAHLQHVAGLPGGCIVLGLELQFVLVLLTVYAFMNGLVGKTETFGLSGPSSQQLLHFLAHIGSRGVFCAHRSSPSCLVFLVSIVEAEKVSEEGFICPWAV